MKTFDFAAATRLLKAAAGYPNAGRVPKPIYDQLVRIEHAPVTFVNGNRRFPQLAPAAYRHAQHMARFDNSAAALLRVAHAIKANNRSNTAAVPYDHAKNLTSALPKTEAIEELRTWFETHIWDGHPCGGNREATSWEVFEDRATHQGVSSYLLNNDHEGGEYLTAHACLVVNGVVVHVRQRATQTWTSQEFAFGTTAETINGFLNDHYHA